MRAAPDYVAIFRGFGEMDDFTGPSRLQQDGTRWILPPSEDLPFFFKAYALDPRTTGIHEGVPGHFFQLSLARRDPDPIRRQYYDSTANEGLGFYTEEMMLQAGLYDDSPRTREIMYEFARLRSLRVEADVKLSTGQFTIPQAADYLARTVPMDRKTAEEDAANYATTPGLGIAYEVGKLQIESLLADRRLQLGSAFNLREFHDYLWTNGNVPFLLLRSRCGLSWSIERFVRWRTCFEPTSSRCSSQSLVLGCPAHQRLCLAPGIRKLCKERAWGDYSRVGQRLRILSFSSGRITPNASSRKCPVTRTERRLYGQVDSRRIADQDAAAGVCYAKVMTATWIRPSRLPESRFRELGNSRRIQPRFGKALEALIA
jgi:hypothetical protein